jgi:type II secretory pathway pseudopilin PulG
MKFSFFIAIIAIIAIIAVIIILVVFRWTHEEKEAFLTNYCAAYKNCISCADASGCSWCQNENRCLITRNLKGSDLKCNQSNTISASSQCKNASKKRVPKDSPDDETETVFPLKMIKPMEDNASNQVLYDFTLYKNQVKDKIPPPNAFTTEELEYTPETVMANTNQLRMDIKNLYTDLPEVMTTALQNQIQPMIKNILSDNYLIQQ